jgi:hypothetical protein
MHQSPVRKQLPRSQGLSARVGHPRRFRPSDDVVDGRAVDAACEADLAVRAPACRPFEAWISLVRRMNTVLPACPRLLQVLDETLRAGIKVAGRKR